MLFINKKVLCLFFSVIIGCSLTVFVLCAEYVVDKTTTAPGIFLNVTDLATFQCDKHTQLQFFQGFTEKGQGIKDGKLRDIIAGEKTQFTCTEKFSSTASNVNETVKHGNEKYVAACEPSTFKCGDEDSEEVGVYCIVTESINSAQISKLFSMYTVLSIAACFVSFFLV